MPGIRGHFSCFGVDLSAAFGAGNDDLPLAHRHPAHRAAGLAGEILVVLVGVAGFCAGVFVLYPPPPVHKLLAVVAEATAETQLVRVAAVMALPTTVRAETLMLQRHQDVRVNPVFV